MSSHDHPETMRLMSMITPYPKLLLAAHSKFALLIMSCSTKHSNAAASGPLVHEASTHGALACQAASSVKPACQ